MIYKYAVISNTDLIVQTVVVWDGVSPWEPPAGTFLVQLEENEPCGAGWLYSPENSPRFTEPYILPE
jgi:hypothetical protein